MDQLRVIHATPFLVMLIMHNLAITLKVWLVLVLIPTIILCDVS